MTQNSTARGDVPPNPRTKRIRTRWRALLKLTLLAALCFVTAAVAMLFDAWVPMGERPSGPRLGRMKNSQQWTGAAFENPEPLHNSVLEGLSGAANRGDHTFPKKPLPVVATDPHLYDSAPPADLRATWLGHSTLILEIDSAIFLTDPVWGERVSPLSWLGPKRWYDPPLALSDLPRIDAILISHDHYDHLDHPTITKLIEETDAPFIAPLGVGSHLEYWGVPSSRIMEVDWWDEVTVRSIKITCTPARHASGRQVFDQNGTLWAGYALRGNARRIFFSGDTGLFNGMREIGHRLGPFDMTFIEVGAYDRAWPDWHLGPEQAVTAHQWLQGDILVPIHWGLFDLANHGWTEPIERVLVEANAQGVRVAQPRPGESVQPTRIPSNRWWPRVPWQNASQHPIRANNVNR